MIIPKKVYPVLALAAVLVFAGLASVHAGAGLPTPWPVEPNVQGAMKTRAEFTGYDRVLDPFGCGLGLEPSTEVYFFLRVRTGNSNDWFVVSGQAAGTFCLLTTVSQKQQALVDFLNDGRVLAAICPECTFGVDFVHIRRVFDDVYNYDYTSPPGEPYAVMAEFELVVNNEPLPVFYP